MITLLALLKFGLMMKKENKEYNERFAYVCFVNFSGVERHWYVEHDVNGNDFIEFKTIYKHAIELIK